MKHKFVKNLYQIISFALSDLLLIMIIFCGGFISGFQDRETNLFILCSIIALIFIYFLIGFYWIFQTVVFSQEGIALYFFRKKLQFIHWEDIQAIERTNVMKNPSLSFTVKGLQRRLNLDNRHSVKKAILHYGTPQIRESIVKDSLK